MAKNRPMLLLEEEIKQDLKQVSKIKIEQWRNKALENVDYFNTMIKIGLTNEQPYCWRCTWVIHKVTAIDTSYVLPHAANIIESLDTFKHQSQIASFLKTLTYLDNINEDYLGKLSDYCIEQIYKHLMPSHVKYYAMQLLVNIAKKVPELAREFSLVLEENRPYYEKAYLRNFAEKSIRVLSKL